MLVLPCIIIGKVIACTGIGLRQVIDLDLVAYYNTADKLTCAVSHLTYSKSSVLRIFQLK